MFISITKKKITLCMMALLILFATLFYLTVMPIKAQHSPFQKYYLDTGTLSGFHGSGIINLYDTEWMLRICNLFQINPPDLTGLQEYIKTVDILNENLKQNNGLNVFPKLVRIQRYLELAKLSNTSLTESKMKDILDYLHSLKQSDSSYIYNKQDASYGVAEIFSLLNLKNEITTTTLSHIKNNKDISKISYYSLLVDLGFQLSDEEIAEINKSKIIINSITDYADISNSYKLYNLKNKLGDKLDTNIEIREISIEQLLHQFLDLNNNQSQIEYQALYDLLLVSNYKLSKQEHSDLENVIKFLYGDIGWYSKKDMFDLYTTYYGLIVFNEEGIKYSTKNISNYLDQETNKIISSSKLTLSSLPNILILTNCYVEINNQDGIKRISDYLKNTIDNVDLEDLNKVPPDVKNELYKIYKLPKLLTPTTTDTTQLEHDMNSNIEAYSLYYELINTNHKFSPQEESQIILGLLKFQSNDGGFSLSPNEPSSISATFTAVKMINNLNLSDDFSKILKYINNQEISSKEPQKIKDYGALILSKRLIGGSHENNSIVISSTN